MIAMLLEIRAEADVLPLEVLLLVRNQEPGDDAAESSIRRTDKKNALDTLVGIVERVLDRREDLRSDGCSGLADCRREPEEWPRRGVGNDSAPQRKVATCKKSTACVSQRR